jgi:hypothetical protein
MATGLAALSPRPGAEVTSRPRRRIPGAGAGIGEWRPRL